MNLFHAPGLMAPMVTIPPYTGTTSSATIGGATTINSVSCGNGVFMAMSTNNTACYTSVNGATWTARTMATSGINSYSGKWCNDRFLAPFQSSTTMGTSADGVTWSTVTLPVSSYWTSPTYANGMYFIASNATANYLTSTDGTTWTSRTNAFTNGWYVVFWTGVRFAAIGSITGTAMTYFAYSTNGTTWTSTAGTLANTYCKTVATNGSIWVTPVNTNNTGYYTTTDGITWTARTFPTSVASRNIVFGNGQFIVFGNGSTATLVSTDGINWTTGPTLPNAAGLTAAYNPNNGVFVFPGSTTAELVSIVS
jgi:hypothetical protein